MGKNDIEAMVFYEKQYFNQWWLWLLFIAALVPLLLIAVFRGPLNDAEVSYDWPAFILIILALVLPLVVLKLIFLETRLDERGIHIRFFPFVNKSWQWSEVKRAEIVNYGFVGGWGIRLWTRYGIVYNVSGENGLALEFGDGRKRLIGTQKLDELRVYINKAKQYYGIQ